MNERIDKIELEIAALYALLDKEERSKSEQYKVDHFESELARLETRYNTLVTALASAPAPAPTQSTSLLLFDYKF
jgi:hypothetical protein